ncbi:translation initiation factor IF-2-like [Falco naumanni]|uniref:translation initiation factor IF-2-like n=1 Tax=Falco naumanni TaxID=148594 RepID=UPI001ADE8BF6|nr:translation initiation factor IF-2-like [Falco naumanni]
MILGTSMGTALGTQGWPLGYEDVHDDPCDIHGDNPGDTGGLDNFGGTGGGGGGALRAAAPPLIASRPAPPAPPPPRAPHCAGPSGAESEPNLTRAEPKRSRTRPERSRTPEPPPPLPPGAGPALACTGFTVPSRAERRVPVPLPSPPPPPLAGTPAGGGAHGPGRGLRGGGAVLRSGRDGPRRRDPNLDGETRTRPERPELSANTAEDSRTESELGRTLPERLEPSRTGPEPSRTRLKTAELSRRQPNRARTEPNPSQESRTGPEPARTRPAMLLPGLSLLLGLLMAGGGPGGGAWRWRRGRRRFWGAPFRLLCIACKRRSETPAQAEGEWFFRPEGDPHYQKILHYILEEGQWVASAPSRGHWGLLGVYWGASGRHLGDTRLHWELLGVHWEILGGTGVRWGGCW